MVSRPWGPNRPLWLVDQEAPLQWDVHFKFWLKVLDFMDKTTVNQFAVASFNTTYIQALDRQPWRYKLRDLKGEEVSARR